MLRRRDLERAGCILGAALRYANDLELFAEEASPDGEEVLGIFFRCSFTPR